MGAPDFGHASGRAAGGGYAVERFPHDRECRAGPPRARPQLLAVDPRRQGIPAAARSRSARADQCGPSSILLELISGGHDAEIRHVGETLKSYIDVERIIEAPSPSLLACIAKKLPIVAISRDFIAFEDEFPTADGVTRCWATLLPLSAGGAWVDYVYALVSVEGAPAKVAEPAKKSKKAEAPDTVSEEELADALEVANVAPDPLEEVAEAVEVAEVVPEPVEELADVVAEEAEAVEEIPVEQVVDDVSVEEPTDQAPAEETAEVAPDEVEQTEALVEQPEAVQRSDEQEPAEAAAPAAKSAPGLSKLFDSLAGLAGFYGSEPVKVEPVIPAPQPADEQPVDEKPVEEQPLAELPPEELPAEKSRPTKSSLRKRRPSNNPKSNTRNNPRQHWRDPCRANSPKSGPRPTRHGRPSSGPTRLSMKVSPRPMISRSMPKTRRKNISGWSRHRG